MDIKNLMNAIGQKSPELLTGIGLTSLAGAAVYCVFADEPKLVLDQARRDIEQQEGEDNVELTKWESAKALMLAYWPAVAMFVVGAGCVIASDCIDDKRQAALSAAYNMSNLALTTFKDKAVEKLGIDKVKEIQEEADVEVSKRVPAPTAEAMVYGNDTGKQLCFDSWSGRYFWSTLEEIRSTYNTLNEQLINENFVSMNEIFCYLGMPECDMGDDVGFNIGITGTIRPRYSSKLVEEGIYQGRPCLVVSYEIEPRYYEYMS